MLAALDFLAGIMNEPPMGVVRQGYFSAGMVIPVSGDDGEGVGALPLWSEVFWRQKTHLSRLI